MGDGPAVLPGLLAWESTSTGYGEETPADVPEETVLLKLAKSCIWYFTDIFLTALFPSFLHPLPPGAEGCSPRCLHGKTFRWSDWPNVIQETQGRGGD